MKGTSTDSCPGRVIAMHAWDLALLDAAESRAILWKLALRMPPGCGTLCRIGAYCVLVAMLAPSNDARY